MTTHPPIHNVVCLIAAVFILGTPACTTRNAYRPVRHGDSVRAHLDKYAVDMGRYDPRQETVPGRESECLEKYSASNFWLGHVEMTDYGTYQSPRQMGVLERAVEQDLSAPGSLFK